MLRIVATPLLFLAWHFPTTFFVPAGSPYEKGWIVWPFGQQTRPAFDALTGVLAPDVVTTTGQPTVAMVAAGIASLAFIVATGALWGIVVPASWLQTSLVLGASASLVLFLVYMSPLALIPLLVDLAILWGVLSQGWSVATFAGA
jgi:hypothetical protein